MTDNDRIKIIARLIKLNEIEIDRLDEEVESKEFWEGRVKEYGRNAISRDLETTYGENLALSTANVEYLQERIKENERLIEVLRAEV